jgi:hypothetical protein
MPASLMRVLQSKRTQERGVTYRRSLPKSGITGVIGCCSLVQSKG